MKNIFTKYLTRSLWTTWFDLVRSIFIKFMEILFEHRSNF